MNYVLTIYADESGWDEVTPEQMQAQLQRWTDLTTEMRDAGAFVAGEGLQPSATATVVKIPAEGEDALVTDGPFAETKEQLLGFYLLECDGLDAALAWAKKVPSRPGSSVEVRPVMYYDEYGGETTAATAQAAS